MRHLAVAFAVLLLIALAALDRFDSPPMLPLVSEAKAAAPEAAPIAAPASLPSPYFLDASTVAYVACETGVGTAFYLGDGKYVTAAHVLVNDKTHELDGCRIGGKPVAVDQMSADGDWALIHAAAYLPFHVVWNCDRLAEGEAYFTTGFALGKPWPVSQRVIAENWRDEGRVTGRGSIVEGMSGGPVSDADGVVHAINDEHFGNGLALGGVVELADTALCHGPKP